jgi:hypothetical protein
MRGLIVEVLILTIVEISTLQVNGRADRIILDFQGAYNIAYGQDFPLIRTSFLVAEGLSLRGVISN